VKITCIDKEVRQILGGDFYVIPRFQRAYSWTRENVDEFWVDAVTESEGGHFIGSVVVYKGGDAKLGVVDGQQRFTTITMALAAIRNAFAKNDLKNLANGIHQFIERKDLSDSAQYVLQTETSYPFLQEQIQKYGEAETDAIAGPEEKLLLDAYLSLQSKVQSVIDAVLIDPTLSKANKQKKLASSLTAVRDRILGIKLIFIELDEETDAYFVFETLNTRGKDLGVSDLAKNHLLRLLQPKNANVDISKDEWQAINTTLENSSIDLPVDSFLYHWWLSRYEYTSSKKLFKLFRHKVTKVNAKSVLADLKQSAIIYRWKHEPSFRKWELGEIPIRDSIEALNVFKVKQDLPMVLAVLRAFEEKTIKPRQAARVLRAIECFHFIFTAVTSQRSSGGISGMYALHARDFSSAKTEETRLAVIDDLILKLKSKLPSEAEFVASFEQLSFSKANTLRKPLVVYVLKSFDRHFDDSGVTKDFSQMTVEHLAPESSDDLDGSHIASIGNLTLLSKKLNSSLGNKGFAAKKSALLKAATWKDEILSEANQWTETEIKKRAKLLGEVGYQKVWKIK
jgi:hypothetical protein